jgi:hypothetical protein
MIVENKSEEKAIQAAHDAVRTAHACFLSMPAAMYFNQLNEAMLDYQRLWFDRHLSRENSTKEI